MGAGRFITLEGGEGAGKSTQLRLLHEAFSAANLPCVSTREPGGSAGAEAIRDLVVQGDTDRWDATTEALLFMTARYNHIHTLIKPALQESKHVLCDRFYDSTYVYQGIAKKVGTAWLDGLYHHLYGNFAPDMTLYLDIDPEAGLKRTKVRGNTKEARFEQMDTSFHVSVREGFLSRAASDPDRVVVINASADAEAVHAAIIQALNTAFSFDLKPVTLLT